MSVRSEDRQGVGARRQTGGLTKIAAQLAPLEEQAPQENHEIHTSGAIVVDENCPPVPEGMVDDEAKGSPLIEPVVLFILILMLVFIVFIAWQVSVMPEQPAR